MALPFTTFDDALGRATDREPGKTKVWDDAEAGAVLGTGDVVPDESEEPDVVESGYRILDTEGLKTLSEFEEPDDEGEPALIPRSQGWRKSCSPDSGAVEGGVGNSGICRGDGVNRCGRGGGAA